MNKKHTNFIVIVLAIVFIRAYNELKYLYNNTTSIIDHNTQFPVFLLIISFISLLICIKYFRQLYYLKNKVYFWTNTFFGYTSIIDAFSILILYISPNQDVVITNTILAIFLIKLAIWPIFFKYLKNKELSGKILTS